MSNLVVAGPPELSAELKAQVLIYKNTAKLSADQKLSFLSALCHSLGLNPLTNPFEFTNINGKEVLYTRKDATDQLRKIHGVSVHKLEKSFSEDYLEVTVYVRDKYGREDIGTGVLFVAGLKGQDLANAKMKCETKAKRRATLSICGLGFLDESEIEDARLEVVRDVAPPALAEPKDELQTKLDEVFAKFRKLGVTADMLREKFQGFELSDGLLAEMNKLGADLKNKRTTIETEFKNTTFGTEEF